MGPSSPEFTAGRVVAVFALERLIRERTALFVWGATAIAAIFWVGAVASDGLGAVFVGALAVVATAVAATLFVVRRVVVGALRRLGGGPDYARLRPIVARRMAEVDEARNVLPLSPPGALRLVWMARRPAALRDHIRATGQSISRTIPGVVADVRRKLHGSVLDVA